MNRNKTGSCKLCCKFSELRVGHVIPASIIKYVKKKTNKSQFFNSLDMRVTEDLAKKRLMCGCCESLFGKYEKYFMEKVYRPIFENTLVEIKYSTEKVKYFILSIVWRYYLCYSTNTSCNKTVSTLEYLRGLLLGEKHDSISSLSIHMMPFERIDVFREIPFELPGSFSLAGRNNHVKIQFPGLLLVSCGGNISMGDEFADFAVSGKIESIYIASKMLLNVALEHVEGNRKILEKHNNRNVHTYPSEFL